jgi:TET-Associated Glycosyltransferase
MSEIPVVVPSHARAGAVRVLDVVANAILCVAESEADAYRTEYSAPIETHPDTVVGICPKRQWMLEHFGDHFSVDDDVKGFRRIYDPEAEPHLDPDAAYEAIQETAEVARQVGAKLWGFSNYPMTYTYDVFKPFKLVGYVNCMSYGIFADSKLWFPDDPEHLGDDYHVSGLNAYFHRYIWLDTRFAFEQVKTFRNPGGLSEFRHSAREEATYDKLRGMFGDAIQLKTTRGGRPPDTSDERKSTTAGHSFEKLLKVPWS